MAMPGGGSRGLVARLETRGLALGRGSPEVAAVQVTEGQSPLKTVVADQVVSCHHGLLHAAFPERTGCRGGSAGLVEIRPEIDFSEKKNCEAIRELAGQLATAGCWGVEDPGLCFFSDLWLEAVPAASLLAIYRHPLEVYDSLLRSGDAPEMAWDFDEARPIHSYVIFMRGIQHALERAEKEGRNALVLAARSASPDLGATDSLVDETLGLGLSQTVIEQSGEKEAPSTLTITRKLHQLFSASFPLAGQAFDQMQTASALPLELLQEDHPDAVACDQVCDALAALLASTGTALSESTLLRLLMLAATASYCEAGANEGIERWIEQSRKRLGRILQNEAGAGEDSLSGDSAAAEVDRLRAQVGRLRRKVIDLERDKDVVDYKLARVEEEIRPSREEIDRIKRDRDVLEDRYFRTRTALKAIENDPAYRRVSKSREKSENSASCDAVD